MGIVHIIFNDPGFLTVYITLYLIASGSFIGIIYLLVASNRRRITDLYLGGEPESIIKEASPSPINLYWGFIKRFARRLYIDFRDKMHTGNLQDWVKLMSSWYGLLLLLSIILGFIYVLTR